MAVVGLLVFPLVIVANLAYQRLVLAADHPHPGAARRGQRDRARVLRRRDGGQDAGPRGRGDRPVRAPRPTSCATSTSAPAGSGRRSTRCSRPAQPRRAGRARRRRRAGCSSGAADAGDVVTVAYLLTIVSFPIRVDRLAARRVPAQRGRLPSGCSGCSTTASDTPYGDAPRSTRHRRGGARLEVDDLGYSYEPGQRLLDDLDFAVEPGPHRRAWSAPPPPARARSPRC